MAANSKAPASDIATQVNPPFVTALARGLAVIRAFSAFGPTHAPTLSELAKATELSRATVRRSLHTLMALGYVQANGRSFTLTPMILTLGYSFLSGNPLVRVAQPLLERVSKVTGESCSMSILDGDQVIYIARAAAQRIMSVDLAIGSRLPTYCTSMGRVLLCELSEPELRKTLGTRPLKAFTAKTIVEQVKLRAALAKTRSDNYAIVDQELEIGLRSIAVPVRNGNNTIIAAINVSAQAGRVSIQTMKTTVLDALRLAANELSAALQTYS